MNNLFTSFLFLILVFFFFWDRKEARHRLDRDKILSITSGDVWNKTKATSLEFPIFDKASTQRLAFRHVYSIRTFN